MKKNNLSEIYLEMPIFYNIFLELTFKFLANAGPLTP